MRAGLRIIDPDFTTSARSRDHTLQLSRVIRRVAGGRNRLASFITVFRCHSSSGISFLSVDPTRADKAQALFGVPSKQSPIGPADSRSTVYLVHAVSWPVSARTTVLRLDSAPRRLAFSPNFNGSISGLTSWLYADEPRRSGRATKGQHPKNLDLPAAASKSSQSKSKRSAKDNSSKATLDADDDDSDAIIRCICGADAEDSDDERMMICCDQCLSWQHNECMEITEDEDALPDKYLCERCSPASHKMLLQKVARGERPWEERIKERQRQEQQKKDRKKRPGKKGKGGRKSKLSETKSEASEQVDEDTVLNEEPRPEDKATPTIATRQKSIEPDSIKSQDAEVGSVKKRKASGGSAEGQVQDMVRANP